MNKKKSPVISIVGLGKLGSPFLVAWASRGFKVIGVDLNKETIRKLNQKEPPVVEPKLGQLLKRHHKNISATTSIQEAISKSDVTFVIVPTPSKKNGAFSNKFVITALRQIGAALQNKSAYHLVAIVSTIMPGSMDNILQRVLETASGKKIGKQLGFCYNPTFIALGNVIHNVLQPDVVLMGTSDQKASTTLTKLYKKLCINHPPIRTMNYINAEIAKIALNTFITTKISYANMLAELCEKLPGADVDIVTQTIGQDSRVGNKYLTGAVAYGGPCFPRDNRALTYAGKKVRVNMNLAQATDKINRRQTAKIATMITSQVKNDKAIGIIGLTYKPDTDVIEESAGILLMQQLLHKKYKVVAYDPLLQLNHKQITQGCTLVDSLKKLVQNSSMIVNTSADKKIATELAHLLTVNSTKRIIVLDCWRTLNPKEIPSGASVVFRGRHEKR